MQFLNQHTSKYQKRSKHFVCSLLDFQVRLCLHLLATRLIHVKIAICLADRGDFKSVVDLNKIAQCFPSGIT